MSTMNVRLGNDVNQNIQDIQGYLQTLIRQTDNKWIQQNNQDPPLPFQRTITFTEFFTDKERLLLKNLSDAYQSMIWWTEEKISNDPYMDIFGQASTGTFIFLSRNQHLSRCTKITISMETQTLIVTRYLACTEEKLKQIKGRGPYETIYHHTIGLDSCMACGRRIIWE